MKTKKLTEIDFSNQHFFIGIDVHKKQWNVSIRTNNLALKTFSMNPEPEDLQKHLITHYPQGIYHSVYEAGYSGLWIDEKLRTLGIENIVVNPADVPTKAKEKLTKTDRVDSRKLARELENGILHGIYIPSKYNQELRSLCRLRYKLSRDQVRIKNRIKGHLAYYGKAIPEEYPWSNRFIQQLKEIEFEYKLGKDYLVYSIEELESIRKRIAEITKKLRESVPRELIEQLMMSVPGVGFLTAATFYCEIMDMRRFKRFEELASYIGLIPSTFSSGQREKTYGLTIRRNKYLREMLIESAWIAVRKDPALLMKFTELSKRKEKSRAIVSIAKKLLRRIRHLWLEEEQYICGLIA